jgi:hypothetical protein
MTQILESYRLIDKTIKRTAYIDNHFFLFFTDDTFCVFKGTCWEEGDVELMNEKYDITLNPYNVEELFVLGIITSEEAKNFKYKLQEKRTEEARLNEIKQLKELKAKYPDL